MEGKAMKIEITWILVLPWIAGVVIAKGFWSVFFAIFFPPWAWYLLVELIMIKSGLL